VAPGAAGGVRLSRDATRITAAMTAKRVTARAADGNSAVVWVEVDVDANTTTLPVIQAWMVQWYSYVPGVVKVCVKLAPSFIIPESKGAAPLGTLNDVTVWSVPPLSVSLLVHMTVLFTPITTVTFSGAKPGAAEGPTPAPTGMFTTTVDWAFATGKAMAIPTGMFTTTVDWAFATGRAIVIPETRRRASPLATARIFREVMR